MKFLEGWAWQKEQLNFLEGWDVDFLKRIHLLFYNQPKIERDNPWWRYVLYLPSDL